MQAVANNPKFAKKVKVPVKVGKEFVKADKAEGAKMKSYRDGGIYTAEMGQPPQDIDGGSAPRKPPAKPKAPAKPKSKYEGYMPMTKSGAVIMDRKKATDADRARGAKYAFDLDKEGMRTAYETYKRDSDPSSKDVSKRMAKADEKAIDSVQKANRASDAEYKREKNRGKAPAMAKGGSIDGIAKRGKTNCKMR
jgi:hypothetical protein